MKSGRKYSDLELYRRLLLEARPYWPHLLALLVLSLLAMPLALLTPFPLRLVVDSVIGTKPLPPWLAAMLPTDFNPGSQSVLLVSIGLLVGISLLSHLQGFGKWLLQTYTGEKVALQFKARLFHHLQRVSLSFHDERGASDSIYRIQNDAASIQHVAVSGVIPFITAALTLGGMLWVTALIDWQIAIVAAGIAPVLYLLAAVCRRVLRDEWFKVKDLESSALSVLHEVLNSLRVVKSFGAEDFEQNRFVTRAKKTVGGQVRLAFIESSFDVLVGLTLALGTGGVLYLGVTHLRSGSLTLGQLLMVMTYLAQLYVPLESISKTMTHLQSAFASAERAFAILDEASDVPEKSDAKPLPHCKGHVVFENVSFEYDSRRRVLHNVSFEVPAGACVGIVGTTGSGKTTLLKLLTRFHDPTSGRILIDGVDIRDYRLADLRNQFAIVLQDSVLFSTTIAENIAYARPEADEAEIIAAATAAHAHEFIMGLPDRYQNAVGERGAELSGGERQRISIARAFLKSAPMLILDEPTSALDAATESIIGKTVQELMAERTTFLVTHRPALLRHCDVVLHLENGELADTASEGAEAAEVRRS